MYNSSFLQIENDKSSQNVLTPNNLIHKAAELLSIPYIAGRIAKKYKYIFIDELQGTNKDQFDLVEIFIQPGIKVILVGDDKQSIYAFRGADIENFLEMHTLIKSFTDEGKSDYLDENFPSTPDVIKTNNHMFAHNFKFNNDDLSFPVGHLKVADTTPLNVDTKPLNIVFSKSVSEIIEETIYSTHINGRQAEYGDIAVLCRRSYDLDKISNELKAAGYPTLVVGGKGFYKAKEIIDTYKLINAILNHDDRYNNKLIFTDYYNAFKTIKTESLFEDYVSEISVIFCKETVEETLTFIYKKSGIFDYYSTRKNY